jgi:alkylation response protein AidB-like acyl-CoA dehydrogenase
MPYLDRELRALEQFLPGLRERLSGKSLTELESPSGDSIQLFREARGCGLLVQHELGGRGATALDAVRVQRALGALAPSLSVASTMHHFTIATLLAHATYKDDDTREILRAVAEGNLLVASGFSEGITNRSVLDNQMLATWDGSTYRINGSKKPCSLSRSMDVLSAGVRVVRDGQPVRRGFAVVFASDPGLKRRPYWNASFLTGTESDEVILEDVAAPEESLIVLDSAPNDMHPMEVAGLTWFTLMISAAYVGMASGLVQRLLQSSKGSESERVATVSELECAAAAIEARAHALASEEISPALLWRAQLVRYATQGAIERASARAVELLGGLASIQSSDIGYLFSCAHALAFHPPARGSSLGPINAYVSAQ